MLKLGINLFTWKTCDHVLLLAEPWDKVLPPHAEGYDGHRGLEIYPEVKYSSEQIQKKIQKKMRSSSILGHGTPDGLGKQLSGLYFAVQSNNWQ